MLTNEKLTEMFVISGLRNESEPDFFKFLSVCKTPEEMRMKVIDNIPGVITSGGPSWLEFYIDLLAEHIIWEIVYFRIQEYKKDFEAGLVGMTRLELDKEIESFCKKSTVINYERIERVKILWKHNFFNINGGYEDVRHFLNHGILKHSRKIIWPNETPTDTTIESMVKDFKLLYSDIPNVECAIENTLAFHVNDPFQSNHDFWDFIEQALLDTMEFKDDV